MRKIWKRFCSCLLTAAIALPLCMGMVGRALAASHTVVEGDSLWRIAEQELGSGLRWNEIYEANRNVIKDPNRLYIGQILELPGSKSAQLQPAGHTHAFSAWAVTKEATCIEEGSQERRCECGEVEKQPIKKTAHQYEKYVCTVCGVLDTENPSMEVPVQDWDNTLPFSCAILDGPKPQTIRGTYYLPEGCKTLEDTKGLHIFFVCHGMRSDSSKDSIKMISTRLASNGILAISFDFRGATQTSMSDGTHLDLSLRTEMNDLNTCIDYVKSQPWAAESDISLFGISQGGCVSLLTAAERAQNEAQNDITCVATWFPALCIQDDVKKTMEKNGLTVEDLPDTLDNDFGKFGMTAGAAKKYFTDIIDWDIVEMVSRYDGPVFMSHGDSDGLVPLIWAEQANEKFNSVGAANCKFDVVAGGDHGYNSENRLKELDRSWAYIREFFGIESNVRLTERDKPYVPWGA